jgi:hypothetical protein
VTEHDVNSKQDRVENREQQADAFARPLKADQQEDARVGVITGFTVRLDPAALGLGIGAYIRIRPAMGECSASPSSSPIFPKSSSATA